MAMPAASAAEITSASFIDPPGWMAAVTPARMPSSRPSGNGKNASDAMTDPRARSPARRTAIWTDSTRDICPAPTPTAAPSLNRTIALDFTCFIAVETPSIPLLDQESAGHRPDVVIKKTGLGRSCGQHDHVLASREDVLRLFQHLGSDDDMGDDLDDVLGGAAIERPVDG